MKTRLFIFLLTACLAAWAQGRSTSGDPRMGGQQPGQRSMGGVPMDATRGAENANMGNPARPNNLSSESPNAVLSHNTKLNSKLETLLPKGMTAQQACTGFKNLGQCVAVIHVSNNLGVSFDDLKAKTAGAHSENLGKAIHDLKPDADAKAEAKKGQKQADQDLSES
jgi:hypothetical protein